MKPIDACAEPLHKALPLELALSRVLASLKPIETIELVDLKPVLGRILAQNVVAHIDIPPFPNSAMDGYALRSQDACGSGGCRLRVVGTAFAGHPFIGTIGPDECVRIFTGASVPSGADAVVMQEEVRREGDIVELSKPIPHLANVRPAGDEVPQGGLVLSTGRILKPSDVGLIASTGLTTVPVFRKLRVAFFSTGDELSPLGEPLAYGQIYDSNRYVLNALLKQPAIEAIDLGVIRDQPEAIRSTMTKAAGLADVVITSGGVSVGEADFVTEQLQTIGRVEFWKVAVKPGKPLAFGQIGPAWFFGLPGNPVAVMVMFHQLVRPALLHLQGASVPPPLRIKAVCRTKLRKSAGRLEFQRGLFSVDEQGEISVAGCGPQGSHRLSTVSQANCFIVLPIENSGVEPGESVMIEPLDGVF